MYIPYSESTRKGSLAAMTYSVLCIIEVLVLHGWMEPHLFLSSKVGCGMRDVGCPEKCTYVPILAESFFTVSYGPYSVRSIMYVQRLTAITPDYRDKYLPYFMVNGILHTYLAS